MLRHRPRLLAALLAGVLVGAAALLSGLTASQAVLVGWCGAALCWMALIVPRMLHRSGKALRERTAALDEGRWQILAATLSAALASLGAVIWALAEAPTPAPLPTVLLGLGTVMVSWGFVHVLFAVHYAHEHCRADRGLVFPGNTAPDFGEFLNFAVTVGMTFQVSDATTDSAAIRRLVLARGLVAFLFNAVILGAAVNLAAALAR